MIDEVALAGLEDEVAAALRTGDISRLRVLGWGEISLVLGSPAAHPEWACKRLPPFRSAADAGRYAAIIVRYIAELERSGVAVAPTEMRQVVRDDGSAVLFCIQPVLPAESLAVNVARDHPEKAEGLLGEIVATVFSVVDAEMGLDAQLSNWATVDGRLTYFDITTPMLRRADGTTELDADVFLTSMPWLLRAPVRRFVVPDILARYHGQRTVVLDLAANLLKERLDALIPAVLAATEGRVDPPLTEAEVRRDYRRDARTWSGLQAIRRADRMWQTKVRRRTYPFLLPGHIER